MNEKECVWGSEKRKNQNFCNECHENFSKSKTASDRVEYLIKKMKKNQE